jgi:ribonuclease P protein component
MVVQKRFWCAVDRNRIKRRLREWFRLHKHQVPKPGKDIVVVARPGAEKLSPLEMAREITAGLARQDGRSS